MKPPTTFTQIIGRKRYSVQTATLIASDSYWDGHNSERRGRNTFLYMTPNGGYFTVTLSQWQGESVTLDEAVELYETSLGECEVSYSDAFPNVKVDDA